ncbi:MAG: PAS-domain containing protein [Telmatospirillum sp.]|nr:PAS-domain containing protein [Telmatospirillum sp.]
MARNRHSALAFGVGLGLCAVVVAATAFVLVRSRTAAVSVLLDSVASIAANTGARIDRELLQTETLLARVPLILGSIDGASQQPVVSGELRLFADQSSLLRDILVVAPDGRLLASALPAAARLPPETLADLLGTFYRGAGETAAIALPRRSRTTGEWVTLIGRTIDIPGAGAALAVGEVEIRAFSEMIADRAPLERRLTIELRDGHLIAASPHDEIAMGRVRQKLPASLLEPDGLPLVGTLRGNGRQNAVAVHAMHNRALVLVATLDIDAGLATWRAERSRIVAAATAFTALILAFAALAHRAEKLRGHLMDRLALQAAVVENTGESIVISDIEGRALWVNAAFERQTGYKAAELIGKQPGTLLQGPGTDPAAVEALRHAIAVQRSCDVEILNYNKAGQPYWQRVRLSPVRDSLGDLTHFIAVQTDVTREREQLASLAAAKSEAERNLAVATVAHNQLRNAMDAMREGLVLFDADDRILKFNAQFVAILGLPEGFVREGMSLMALTLRALEIREPALSPAARAAKAAARIAVHRLPQAREEELSVCGRAVDIRRTPLPDGGIIYVYRDVTDERRATEQLRRANEVLHASEVRLALALETANLGWWERTIDGHDYWSARAREIWGIEPDVPPSVAAWRQRLHPEDRDAIDDSFDLADGRHVRNYRVVHADGSVRYVRSQRLIMRESGTSGILALGTVLDYTDLETLRRAAELDRETLASAINAMREGILIYDASERLVSWNERVLEICPWLDGILAPGIAYASIPRAALERADGDRTPEEIEAAIAERHQSFVDGDGRTFELAVEGRVLHVTRIPVAAGGSIGIVRDVTEQKAYQAELEEARRAAEAASEAKTRFLANMSHELRTPLAGIVSMLGLLDEAALDEEGRRQVSYARGSAKHLISVVGNILDLSKLEISDIDLNRHPFDLALLTNDSVHPLGATAQKKGLALEIAVADSARGVRVGDAVRIRQILTNLVGNAIKFTMVGRVSVEVSAAGDFVTFAVTDTGPGIARDEQALLFEDFAQVDSSSARRHEGAGLGLAISRRLAVAMAGALTVESDVGRGATFRLVLPLPQFVGPTGNLADPAAPPARLDGTWLLLAEDNEVNRYGIVRILEKMGAKVDAVRDGAEAVAAASRRRYDAILMDVQMPGIDGLEATREIRAGSGPNKGTLIVALTANAFTEDRSDCLRVGMDRFLTKPVGAADLAQALGDSARMRAVRTPPQAAAPAGDPALWIDRARIGTLEIDGGPGFAATLIGRFAATLELEVRSLDQAFAAGDVAKVAAIGHALKSSSRMVGAAGLGEAAETLERIAFDASPEALRDAIAAFSLRAQHFRSFAAQSIDTKAEG